MEPHWLFACQSQRGYVFGSSHEPQSEFGAASRKCTDWLCLAGLVCTGGRAAQQRSRCLQRSVLDCKTDPAKPPRALRLLCTSVNGPYAPWSSTELKLEQHFGHLRGQFANSQLRTRDYLHASAKKSYQTWLKMQHQSPTLQENLPKRVEKPLSDETFIACSERALNSALRLMAACSEFLGLSFAIGSIGMF